MTLDQLGLMVLLLCPAMLMSVLFLITMASEDFSGPHAPAAEPESADANDESVAT